MRCPCGILMLSKWMPLWQPRAEWAADYCRVSPNNAQPLKLQRHSLSGVYDLASPRCSRQNRRPCAFLNPPKSCLGAASLNHELNVNDIWKHSTLTGNLLFIAITIWSLWPLWLQDCRLLLTFPPSGACAVFLGETTVEETYDRMFTVSSRVRISVTKEDDGVPVDCIIEHPAVKDLLAQRHLDVLCEWPQTVVLFQRKANAKAHRECYHSLSWAS